MIPELQNADFFIQCIDGAQGMLQLPDKSVKLVYGSPPYPNAERDYGVWHSSEYIEKMAPFIEAAKKVLRDDGFLVINVKANREKATSRVASKRSLIVEKLAILLEENWGLHCVDIEIWVKENPAPTGLRVACQDAYEQTYRDYEYKPRGNGLTYVRKNKMIQPNPLGALPKNIISGGVSASVQDHQAVQPLYLPEKYIKATTAEGDVVLDPWMGSGTTGVAALQLNRKFVGYDIMPEYVTFSDNRLKAVHTGV